MSGYQTVNRMRVPVEGPANTLARMAQVVGVTPEQLQEAGREDAAEELRALPPLEEPEQEPTVAELQAAMAREWAEMARFRERGDRMEQRIAELEQREREREQRERERLKEQTRDETA